MIGILLISHGGFAAGLKDSLQLIVGEFEKVDTAMYESKHKGKGTLTFAD